MPIHRTASSTASWEEDKDQRRFILKKIHHSDEERTELRGEGSGKNLNAESRGGAEKKTMEDLKRKLPRLGETERKINDINLN